MPKHRQGAKIDQGYGCYGCFLSVELDIVRPFSYELLSGTLKDAIFVRSDVRCCLYSGCRLPTPGALFQAMARRVKADCVTYAECTRGKIKFKRCVQRSTEHRITSTPEYIPTCFEQCNQHLEPLVKGHSPRATARALNMTVADVRLRGKSAEKNCARSYLEDLELSLKGSAASIAELLAKVTSRLRSSCSEAAAESSWEKRDTAPEHRARRALRPVSSADSDINAAPLILVAGPLSLNSPGGQPGP